MKGVAVVVVLLLVVCVADLSSCARSDYIANDKAGITTLQGVWYDSTSGLWNSTNTWNSANILNALIDFSIYTSNPTAYISVIENTFNKNQVFWLEGIDDEGWWGLAWARAYKLTGNAKYLNLAELVLKDMAKYWDDTCKGGVWWNRVRTYKNAITNELFFALAAALYQHTNNQEYLNWAQKEWAWLESSTMLNAQGLFNDGINNGNCQNNGQTTWTYNQGVVLGGLADLWRATKNDTLLKVALRVANATFTHLVYSDGILREPCEPNKDCDGDQTQFKGIFMRHLGYLYQVTNDASVGNFISKNANSIWQRGRSTDGRNNLGLYWEGPYDQADASRQSSAIDAINAAVLLP